MTAWKRRLLLLLALGSVGAIGISQIPAAKPTFKAVLSDGIHEIRFVQSGAGLNYSSDGSFRDNQWDWLPAWQISGQPPATRVLLRPQRNEAGGTALQMLFLLSSRDPKPPSLYQLASRLELEGTDGFVHRANGYGGMSYQEGVMTITSLSFPRRDRQLHMRLFELGGAADTERLIFDLQIANPLYEPDAPVWDAETLPTVKSAGPFTLALKGVSCRRALPADAKERGEAAGLVMEPEFALQVADNSSEMAMVDWRWQDPTGNSSRAALSPFESCLKLAVSVRRKPEAMFSAHEIWSLDPIPLDQFSGHPDFNEQRTLDGVDLAITQLIGPGIVRDGQGQFHQVPPVNNRLPTFVGQDGSPSRDLQFSCFSIRISCAAPADIYPVVKDQLGRVLNRIEQIHTDSVQGDTFRMVSFEPQPDSTSAQLTISMNRPQTFEFYVEPSEEARELARKDASDDVSP